MNVAVDRAQLIDVGIAAGALLTVSMWGAAWGGESLDPWGWVATAVSSVVLLFRRHRPVLVAAVVLVICCVYYPLSDVDGAIWPALVVALYTAAAQSQVIAAVVLTATALLAFAFTGFETGTPHLADAAAVLLGGWFAAAVALGVVVHSRRAYSLAMEQRRAEELQRRAAQERLRIARDLHDALGHSLSVIHVQSSAALHRLSRHPDEARAALAAVKESSRAALNELRSTLGALRQAEPGLAHVEQLAEQSRATGLDIALEVEGTPREPSAEVGLAAFRIVQESLTNITRHAYATSATVLLHYREAGIDVRIEDNGRGRAGGSSGNGLRGMAERARSLGGEFSAGNRAGGGFVVHAHLPEERT